MGVGMGLEIGLEMEMGLEIETEMGFSGWGRAMVSLPVCGQSLQVRIAPPAVRPPENFERPDLARVWQGVCLVFCPLEDDLALYHCQVRGSGCVVVDPLKGSPSLQLGLE